jgi:hypothetical protein
MAGVNILLPSQGERAMAILGYGSNHSLFRTIKREEMQGCNMIDGLKIALKNKLLSMANIQQIHIIGCARSGTTMLHYALVAFQNVILHDFETFMWDFPTLRESVSLFKNYGFKSGKSYYATKRVYGWFEMINETASYIKKNKVFVIQIVRDPRAVLSSTHGRGKIKNYVQPWRWSKSIAAGDILFQKLDRYPDKMTIRYEDVLSNPLDIQEQLTTQIGLELRPNVHSWDRLKDNLLLAGQEVGMASYMHKIRNFDPSGIFSWQNDKEKVEYIKNLFATTEYKNEIDAFMQRYNYI